MNRLADTMARAAAGYTGARAKDMAYPRILDDLAAHGWADRPDHELDGTLPPIPSAELGERRGYRRGWVRGRAHAHVVVHRAARAGLRRFQ